MTFLWAFVLGGLFCVAAQLVADWLAWNTAQVLVLFVVLGAILGAVGIYPQLVAWAGAGATIPLPGFGYTMVKGVSAAAQSKGILGLFTGGLTAGSAGIKAAVLMGLTASLVFKPKT